LNGISKNVLNVSSSSS